MSPTCVRGPHAAQHVKCCPGPGKVTNRMTHNIIKSLMRDQSPQQWTPCHICQGHARNCPACPTPSFTLHPAVLSTLSSGSTLGMRSTRVRYGLSGCTCASISSSCPPRSTRTLRGGGGAPSRVSSSGCGPVTDLIEPYSFKPLNPRPNAQGELRAGACTASSIQRLPGMLVPPEQNNHEGEQRRQETKLVRKSTTDR